MIRYKSYLLRSDCGILWHTTEQVTIEGIDYYTVVHTKKQKNSIEKYIKVCDFERVNMSSLPTYIQTQDGFTKSKRDRIASERYKTDKILQFLKKNCDKWLYSKEIGLYTNINTREVAWLLRNMNVSKRWNNCLYMYRYEGE